MTSCARPQGGSQGGFAATRGHAASPRAALPRHAAASPRAALPRHTDAGTRSRARTTINSIDDDAIKAVVHKVNMKLRNLKNNNIRNTDKTWQLKARLERRNSTRRWVELRRYRHPHRRNSTVADDRQYNWPSWTAYSQSARSWSRSLKALVDMSYKQACFFP